jgi:spoIIIJ-associated protein
MNEQQLTAARQWLEELLTLTGFPAEVELGQPSNDPLNYWLTIQPAGLSPGQVETLIGTEGANLDAMQYLANATFSHNEEGRHGGLIVELEGYRQRRAAELRVIADRAAEQVRATGQEYVMPPLSGAERRQLHTFFEVEATYADLSTYSRGMESDRRLVVKLAGQPERE